MREFIAEKAVELHKNWNSNMQLKFYCKKVFLKGDVQVSKSKKWILQIYTLNRAQILV